MGTPATGLLLPLACICIPVLIVAGAAAYALLLSRRLALLVVACMAAAIVAQAALLVFYGAGALTFLLVPTLPVIGVAACHVAAQFALEICRGAPEASAAGLAAAQARPSLLCAAITASAGYLALALSGLLAVFAALVLAAGAAVALLAVLVLLPGILKRLHFSEAYVMRLNRARERRERFCAPLALLAEPRWAYCFLGITAVVIAIAVFEAPTLSPPTAMLSSARLGLFVTALVAGISGACLARDWRMAFVTALPPFAGAGLGAMFAGSAAAGFIAPLAILSGAAAAAMMMPMVAALTAYRRLGDSVTLSYIRVMQETGATLLAFGGVAFLSALAAAPFIGGASAIADASLAISAAVMVLFPALASVFETLLPPRRSVEALYGTR